MKRLLFLLLSILLLVQSAWGAPYIDQDNVLSLTFTGGGATFQAGNSTWIYGIRGNDGKTLVRVTPDQSTQQEKSSVDSLSPITKNIDPHVVVSDDTLVLTGQDANSVSYILRTTDGGATFNHTSCDGTSPFKLGDGNNTGGSDTPYILIYSQMSANATNYPGQPTGAGDIIFGEYNYGAVSRTSGGTNDRVRIFRSTDGGANWVTLATWNTSGHQVSHIHNVRQDPSTGYIYVAFGDSNDESGIVRWDGVTAWPDNTSISDFNSIPGFKSVSGDQATRTVGFTFNADNVFIMSDTYATQTDGVAAMGIWKYTKDLSSRTRVLDTSGYDPMHSGSHGITLSNGAMVFATRAEYDDASHSWTQNALRLYASWDGDNWSPVADYLFSPSTGSGGAGGTFTAPYMNLVNDKILISDKAHAESHNHTAVLTTFGTFTGSSPVRIHPVFYVGAWNASGNDSNTGFSKNKPKLTLTSMLARGEVSYGARVRLAAGTFTENSIVMSYNDCSWGAGSTLYSPVIEGEGKTSTIVRKTSGTGTLFSITSANSGTSSAVPFIFKNLSTYNSTATESNPYNFTIGDGVGIIFNNVKIGSTGNASFSLLSKGVGSKVRYIPTINRTNPFEQFNFGF